MWAVVPATQDLLADVAMAVAMLFAHSLHAAAGATCLGTAPHGKLPKILLKVGWVYQKSSSNVRREIYGSPLQNFFLQLIKLLLRGQYLSCSTP